MNNEFATVFKKLKNRNFLGAVVGSVLEPPPNLRIIINDKIILEKEHIYISSHILKGYKRTLDIEASIELEGKEFLLEASPYVINDTSAGGPRMITSIPEGQTSKIKLKGDIKGEGSIEFTDTLIKGDMVLLIASSDNQNFFLIDKGEKLK